MKGTITGWVIILFCPLLSAQNLSNEFKQIYSKLDQLKSATLSADASVEEVKEEKPESENL